MKEYLCIKDYYLDDEKVASKGDRLVLFDDNKTVVNNSNGYRAQIDPPCFLGDREHFYFTYATKGECIAYPVIFSDNSNGTITFEKDAFVFKEEKVNHPSHYTWLKDKCGIEVIDITRHLDFNKGNAVKYLLRAGYKAENGYSNTDKEIEDLNKAIWYIKDRINQLNGNKSIN